jgi:pectate lyase
VTISWSRFENSSHAILLGLSPETFFDSLEHLTAHHNYFTGLKGVGILNHGNNGHYYNNFFMSNGTVGVACTDRARCLLENNIFNVPTPIYSIRVDVLVRQFLVLKAISIMIDNWLAEGGRNNGKCK